MTASEIIAISSSSGTVNAGLKSFISLFERRTDIKDVLKISDDELKIITEAKDILSKIYSIVKTLPIDD